MFEPRILHYSKAVNSKPGFYRHSDISSCSAKQYPGNGHHTGTQHSHVVSGASFTPEFPHTPAPHGSALPAGWKIARRRVGCSANNLDAFKKQLLYKADSSVVPGILQVFRSFRAYSNVVYTSCVLCIL